MEHPYHIADALAAPPCTVVIFGASGDLARRKLVPALYNLRACGQPAEPHNFAVLGFARRPISLEKFRADMRDAIARYSRLELDDKCWSEFASHLDYLPGLDQPSGFDRLKTRLEQLEASHGLPPNRIYYLSIPPEAIDDCVARLDHAGLIAKPDAAYFTRVVVEKPIGHDLESARETNRAIHRHFDESQIFRIDHYLGKETVQNLLVLRFANTIFERMWGARNVDHLQITVAESEGVGSRAMYYDPAGALRDMVQNHMLQLLAMIAMEPPVSLNAGAIREAKLNVLRALRTIDPGQAKSQVVRGRYTAGTMEGEAVPGYLDESGIPRVSRTETFVGIKTFVDNWRWSGVPFYLRTGKRLRARESLIYIQFKDVPRILFNRAEVLPANALTLRIQPDEGFSFEVLAKQPGLGVAVRPVRMNLRYASEFSGPSPDAYERLLLDVMGGDHTLFVSSAFVEQSWRFVQSILDQWAGDPSLPLHEYAAGSMGPEAADRLIQADGRSWVNLTA
ncbi:MAG TPA: glucose-6-phosphate dehydrogenase [Candidatus Binataceae bacterium]|nr:glucose-6-phosphate dehydrogenase [Candidatus Binataceae bacterium]